MAKKKTTTNKFSDWHCGECANAHDWHNLTANGIPTMARCPFYEDDKWCVWRSKQACEHFKLLKVKRI